MANNTIKVIDFNDKEEKTYPYCDLDTFGDLKRNIAQEERYQGTEKVQMFLACIPLPDDLYIKDVIDMEENGFFIEFPNYASVTATEDTYVWAGKHNCKKLFAGHQETIRVARNGNFGVARRRFVSQNILTFHRHQVIILHLVWKRENMMLGCTKSNRTGNLKSKGLVSTQKSTVSMETELCWNQIA